MSLPNLSRNNRPLFVVRSDLRSCTGYARAARALMELLPDRFDVVGVDIHPNPEDRAEIPSCRLVTDGALMALIRAAAQPVIVLHYTGPDDFRYFPGAINAGSFYWETNATPQDRRWDLKLNLMQAIWAPTHFVAEIARCLGYTGTLELITWPHDFQAAPAKTDLVANLPVQYVQMANVEPASPTLAPLALKSLRKQARNLFLSVQSLAPRKGTRVLLNEWRQYVRGSAPHDVLLLRLAFRHAMDFQGDPLVHFGTMLREAGFQPNEPTQIALIPQSVDDACLQSLYRTADAYVTASFGEGFGGPVVEALQQERLVIAPRHTGLNDLLAAENPFAVRSRSLVVGLKGGLPVYPIAANWHVPEMGGIASALRRFAAMPVETRSAEAAAARKHAADFCSRAVVRQKLHAAIDQLLLSNLANITPIMAAAE